MQKKGFNGLKSMLIILLLTGDLLYGLMNARLNVEQVYGQYGHGIHQLSNSKKVMSMLYGLERGSRRCFGLALLMIDGQD